MRPHAAKLGILITVCLLVTGCGRLGFGSGSDSLPAAPTGPVEGRPLEPLDLQSAPSTQLPKSDDQVTAGGDLEPVPGGTQAPPVAPAQSAALNVGRSDLLGGWKLRTDGDSCQLFMNLTTWSGGYRATTKGCRTVLLQSITAWNLEGKQVQLKNNSGAVIAYLFPTAAERFDGQLHPGRQAITFNR
jgi:hypothetical protein